jgi:DNA-binding PadR family transcriptional regulator
MPGNRRITNPLALAVLTHLFECPRHPYELAATLKERRKEASIKLNYGSLYSVIEGLEREGYIARVETRREGRRPEKTVYRITEAGEAYMFEWMRELVSVPVKEYPQFEAALSLLPVLTPEEVVSLLETRVRHLKQALATSLAEAKTLREMKLPRLFAIESEYHEAMLKAELGYSESLLDDIRSDADGIKRLWKQLHKQVLASRKPAGRPGKSPSKRKKSP